MSEAVKVLETLGGIEVARAVAPFLHGRVERLAIKAGIEKPRVFLIREEAPNACAVGLSASDSAVAVTTGLVSVLDEQEIEAVLAHEVAHIAKGHSVAKTRVAMRAVGMSLAAGLIGGAIATSDLDLTPDDGDADDWLSAAGKALGGAVVQAGGNALAGSMLTDVSLESEFEADEMGGQLCGKPWALIRALRKLEDLLLEGERQYAAEISQLFIVSPAYLHYETHPPTIERIGKLQMQQSLRAEIADQSTLFCTSCGEKTDSDGKYCYWCGSGLEPG